MFNLNGHRARVSIASEGGIKREIHHKSTMHRGTSRASRAAKEHKCRPPSNGRAPENAGASCPPWPEVRHAIPDGLLPRGKLST